MTLHSKHTRALTWENARQCVTNAASPVRVQADALECLSQLVRSDVNARSQFVEINGLEIVFECRDSPHHVVRKRGLEVIENLLLQNRSDCRDNLDRFSDEILSGICTFLTISPREVAEGAGRLLMRLSRMATASGDMFQSTCSKVLSTVTFYTKFNTSLPSSTQVYQVQHKSTKFNTSLLGFSLTLTFESI